jgi:hypothetical protein
MPTQIRRETEPVWMGATKAASICMVLSAATIAGIALIVVSAYTP